MTLNYVSTEKTSLKTTLNTLARWQRWFITHVIVNYLNILNMFQTFSQPNEYRCYWNSFFKMELLSRQLGLNTLFERVRFGHLFFEMKYLAFWHPYNRQFYYYLNVKQCPPVGRWRFLNWIYPVQDARTEPIEN